jgi:hypothetical protein
MSDNIGERLRKVRAAMLDKAAELLDDFGPSEASALSADEKLEAGACMEVATLLRELASEVRQRHPEPLAWIWQIDEGSAENLRLLKELLSTRGGCYVE